MECSVNELSRYRFETSLEDLDTALDGFDSSKHSGIISFFNQNYTDRRMNKRGF